MLSRMMKLLGAKTLKPSPELGAKFEQALAASRLERLADSASICREILALQPDHLDALMLYADISARENDLPLASQLYAKAAERHPEHPPAHLKLGSILAQLNRLDAALASYDRAISLNPGDSLALLNRGVILHRTGRSADALASYNRAIAANADPGTAYCNRGTLLMEMGRWNEAVSSYDKAIEAVPRLLQAHLFRGRALQELKQPDAALAAYDKAIEIEPRFAEAYKYRGVLLYQRKDLEAAISSYAKAIELDPGNAEAYYNRGLIFQNRKQFDAALADYDKAIELVPHFAEAHLNRGAVLYLRKRIDAALASFDKAIELDPQYADAFLNRGRLLGNIGRSEAALASLDRAIALAPRNVEAHECRGATLFKMRRLPEAIAAYDRVHELNPDYSAVQRAYIRMNACDWDHFQDDVERIEAEILADETLSASLLSVSAMLDDPALQLRAAKIWARDECPPDGSLGAIPQRARGGKIRIGYYSPDFRWHSVARLTAGLFEHHDRDRFEITAFAFGPEAADPMRKRLEQAFDRFIDVRNRSDQEVAALSRELGIDIAVDLGGYTADTRPNIFALRAAPIQLSYIGFLGSMGAPFMDYLVADATIIPPERRVDYSEKILYLPWYQVNDPQREMSTREFTREELGLPPQGFVFSCFNTLYKVQPSTFDSWMRILKRVEGSSLFLVVDNPTAHQNLPKEAQLRGIEPHRIVFGRRLEVDEYLARCRAMDLFLDTWPYNAGTTASDALWTGLPLVTYQGQSFASRSASSMLQAVGLPELITTSPEQYEDLAVDLALNPRRLAEIRRQLVENRETLSLFDVAGFTAHLESAYTRIWERYLAGLPPDHILPEPLAAIAGLPPPAG